MAQPSEIAQLLERFQRALSGMSLSAPPLSIEGWAVLVHRSMTLGRRRFHTTRHVLTVTRDLPPMGTLAGLFHDLVYVQVDDGFPAQVAERLAQLAAPVEGGWRLSDQAGLGLPGLCSTLFAVEPGQVLGPFTGVNEYLSAVVCVETLEGLLGPSALAQLAACIEATIPFRGRNPAGQTPLDALGGRLRLARERHGLELDDAAVEGCLDHALQLANRDLENFAEADPGRFLTNTWALLPETNPPLKGFGVYSIVEYRRSLGRMEAFLNHLDPMTIFQQRSGLPGPERFAELERLSTRNVDVARRYLGIKLFTIGLIEAFAHLTGGDAPISLFMGDIEGEGRRPLRVEDQLSDPHPEPAPGCDPVMLDLLHVGRAGASHFDMQNSPLSSYLYRALGEDRMMRGLDRVHQMFVGDLGPRSLLDSLDRGVVQDLGQALASMVPTRRDALLALAG